MAVWLVVTAVCVVLSSEPVVFSVCGCRVVGAWSVVIPSVDNPSEGTEVESFVAVWLVVTAVCVVLSSEPVVFSVCGCRVVGAWSVVIPSVDNPSEGTEVESFVAVWLVVTAVCVVLSSEPVVFSVCGCRVVGAWSVVIPSVDNPSEGTEVESFVAVWLVVTAVCVVLSSEPVVFSVCGGRVVGAWSVVIPSVDNPSEGTEVESFVASFVERSPDEVALEVNDDGVVTSADVASELEAACVVFSSDTVFFEVEISCVVGLSGVDDADVGDD